MVGDAAEEIDARIAWAGRSSVSATAATQAALRQIEAGLHRKRKCRGPLGEISRDPPDRGQVQDPNGPEKTRLQGLEKVGMCNAKVMPES